jgi:2-polyprenyl-3-methyl-5-hydroxy-6-metoxy-1,4-benzoquinol methylase
MTHDHSTDDEMFTPEFWDARYGAIDRLWSGNPNPQLVAEATDLDPATALDVGCGEGADAIWLASRGWQVTAVDVSQVALRRGAEQAERISREVAKRLTWEQADVSTWDPAPRQFDLVTAQFMYLPPPDLKALHARLAAAVRPGGSLLIVGHHPVDLATMSRGPKHAAMLFTAEQVAATLPPADWNLEVVDTRPRQILHEGELATFHDAVLHAVRH